MAGSTGQQPKTILLLSEYGVLNGGEHSLLTLIKYWQLSSLSPWKFVAAVPRATPLESALLQLKIDNVGLSLKDDNGIRLSQLEIRNLLVQTIERVGPDLVHANSLAMSRLVGPVAKELLVPSVGYLRDIVRMSKTAIGDVNQVDQLIAVSQATKDFHVAAGLDHERVNVVYNGVDSDTFSPAKDEAQANAIDRLKQGIGLSDDPVLLFVGQIGMRKGLDILLDAFEESRRRFPGLQLLIVGQRNSTKQESMDYEVRLQEKSETSPLAGSVHWLGRRSDVADLMRLATVLVHPARQEPLGRVLLEAAASGLPIVSTLVGGTPEILTGELSQTMMTEKDSVEGFVSRIERLLVDPDFRAALSEELQAIATSRFSVVQCAVGVNGVYVSTLDEATS